MATFALIFDLRAEPHGGSPGGVVLPGASYLAAERTHLNDIFFGGGPAETQQLQVAAPMSPALAALGRPVARADPAKRVPSPAARASATRLRAARAGPRSSARATGGGAHPTRDSRSARRCRSPASRTPGRSTRSPEPTGRCRGAGVVARCCTSFYQVTSPGRRGAAARYRLSWTRFRRRGAGVKSPAKALLQAIRLIAVLPDRSGPALRMAGRGRCGGYRGRGRSGLSVQAATCAMRGRSVAVVPSGRPLGREASSRAAGLFKSVQADPLRTTLARADASARCSASRK